MRFLTSGFFLVIFPWVPNNFINTSPILFLQKIREIIHNSRFNAGLIYTIDAGGKFTNGVVYKDEKFTFGDWPVTSFPRSRLISVISASKFAASLNETGEKFSTGLNYTDGIRCYSPMTKISYS